MLQGISSKDGTNLANQLIKKSTSKSSKEEESKNKSVNEDASNKLEELSASSRGYSKDMVLAKKGEAAYMVQMDSDGDGEVTYEEFLDYCDKNSVSEGDRQALLEQLMKARLISKIEKPEDDEDKKDTGEDKDKKDSAEETDENSVSYDKYLEDIKNVLADKENKNSKNEKSKADSSSADTTVKECLNAYFGTKTVSSASNSAPKVETEA